MKHRLLLACTFVSCGWLLVPQVNACTIEDEGYPDGRVWYDFDGNGEEDYCRTVGNDENKPLVRCQFVNTDGSCGEVKDMTLSDMGYPGTRSWSDRNGDQYPDFCREVGNRPRTHIRCNLWDEKNRRLGKQRDF